jgi:hypothetical protein
MSNLRSLFGGAFDPFQQPERKAAFLPPGDYIVLVEKEEVKATKAGTGHYLEIQFQVIDGQFKGRKLWDRFNVDNPNGEAVRIALEALAELGRAANIHDLSETSALLNKTAKVRVAVKDDKNEIRKYESVTPPAAGSIPFSQQTAPMQLPPVAPPQTGLVQPPPAAGFKPPWQK